MANTRFKIDNGLNVVGDSDFFGNVSISRNVTTSNLTVSNRIVIPGGDLNTQLATVGNTVSVANNTLTYNNRKIKFADTGSLSVQATDDGTTTTLSFTVASAIPGAQGFQGFQGRQGVQGAVGGFTGSVYTFSNATAGSPASGVFRYDNNTNPFTNITKIFIADIDKFGNNVETYLTSFDDSTTTTKGHIVLRELNTNKTAILQVTSLIDQAGFVEISVTNEIGSYFSDGNDVSIEFYRTGDVGAQGFQGRQGAVGIQGAQGVQGAPGVGAQGFQGFQGVQGAVGVGGGIRFTYDNNNNTTVDPGSGNFRFNVNSVSGEPTITEIAFNDSDISSTNVRPFILTWDDSTNIPEGYVIITDNSTQKQIIFTVSSITTAAGFTRITVAHLSGTYPLASSACKIEFSRIGNVGNQGFQGVQGGLGIQGAQGFQGRQGVQGVIGVQGAQGFQGVIGVQGAAGLQGAQGVQGAIGVQGAAGLQGAAGPSTTINATNDTSTATLYPVFVGATGSDQTAKATPSRIEFNAATGELKSKLRSYTENVIATSITSTYTANLALSNIFDLTLTSASTTITFTNAPASGTAISVTLILRQPGSSSNTVSYANTVNWSFSEAPILATGPNKLDTVTLITLNGGTTFFATHALANVAY